MALQPRGGSATQRIWRLSHFLLRTSEHNGRPAVAAGQRVWELSLTTADHLWMREKCQTSTELVKADNEAAPGTIFTPPPNSQLCQDMAYNFSFFFRGTHLDPVLLKRSLRGLLSELPHLAGRGRVLGSGSCLADSVLACNNAGVEVATASARNIRLQDVAPHTWSAHTGGHPMSKFPMRFYAQPMDTEAVKQGKEAPFRVRLTELADGQVLNLSCWHPLADGGRATALFARMAEHYRALQEGRPVGGQRLSADSRLFHSPADMLEALADRPSDDWQPTPLDSKLSVRQWLSLPGKLKQHSSSRWDVHTLYLPRLVLERLKAATIAAGGGFRVSTSDATQALLCTLVNDLRGRSLVPTSSDMITVNADLLHGHLPLKEEGLGSQYFGNAVQLVQLRGSAAQGLDPAQFPTRQHLFAAAVAANARLIREGVSALRADLRGALNAVAEQHQMVRLHRLRLLANFIVKGADQKSASTSSIAKLPVHKVDFGSGGPQYLQVEVQPWFDWWSQPMPGKPLDTVGIDDGQGVLVRTVMEHGLAQKLREHPVWGDLLAGAQLCVGGEAARPLGVQAAGSAPHTAEAAEELTAAMA